jgi:putative FmdB family regulatory protein
MPTYVYWCEPCDEYREAVRAIAKRDECPTCLDCEKEMQRILVAPAMQTWKQDRAFHNLTWKGDGSKTFETKHEYNQYLAENDIAEIGINAPIKTPHGNKVIWRGRI